MGHCHTSKKTWLLPGVVYYLTYSYISKSYLDSITLVPRHGAIDKERQGGCSPLPLPFFHTYLLYFPIFPFFSPHFSHTSFSHTPPPPQLAFLGCSTVPLKTSLLSLTWYYSFQGLLLESSCMIMKSFQHEV